MHPKTVVVMLFAPAVILALMSFGWTWVMADWVMHYRRKLASHYHPIRHEDVPRLSGWLLMAALWLALGLQVKSMACIAGLGGVTR